jgi:DNA-3-methyladenine glycosylase II
MDVAGGAGAAAAAQREQLVEAVVADHFHDAQPLLAGHADSVPSRVTTISLGMWRGSFERKKREVTGGRDMLGGRAQIKRGAAMGIAAEQLQGIAGRAGAARAGFARRSGMPAIRSRAQRARLPHLLRTIVGQQVSVQSAAALWNKLLAQVGEPSPANILAASDEQLRAAGLSRQKASYARSLAEEVLSGRLDLDNLAEADEAAIAQLVAVKGIGRWSAEIYLLFAEGRPDIWPAGDLAVQIAIGPHLGLPEKPSERRVRELAEPWSPHRGAAAIFAWHHYKIPDPLATGGPSDARQPQDVPK